MSRFSFQGEIGSGGFGVVRRASRLDDDGNVVDTDLAAKFLDDVDDEDAAARFVREVRLLHEELDHENIVPILGRNLKANPPWFVMPLAESNLADELAGGRAGDRDWVVHVFTGILEGMAHAHEREEPVLHRDLKPPNVLFCKGVPKVADFGLGKRLSAQATTLTKTATYMGTEPYMAPEQFSDAKRVGTEADVYALGKVLWEMLTGQEPDILYVDLDAVPSEFRFFIEKCCRRDPAGRFHNAAEALASFSLFATTPGLVDPPFEAAEKLVAEWTETDDPNARLGVLHRIDEHFKRNADEEELFFKVVPRLPEDLVDTFSRDLPDEFVAMLRLYDGHIVGGLPFSYCDVVANFYSRLFRATDDLELGRLLLARVITMGASHNRWYVGEVVGRLLADIDDVSTAMMAAEVVEQDAYHAAWFWDPWVKRQQLMRPIAEGFERVLDVEGDESDNAD
jgi:serine/threonine protein kinase